MLKLRFEVISLRKEENWSEWDRAIENALGSLPQTKEVVALAESKIPMTYSIIADFRITTVPQSSTDKIATLGLIHLNYPEGIGLSLGDTFETDVNIPDFRRLAKGGAKSNWDQSEFLRDELQPVKVPMGRNPDGTYHKAQ